MGSIVPGILEDFITIIFFTILHIVSCGRCNGLLPSTLVPRSSSLVSIPDHDIVLCSWSRHFTVPLNLATAVWTSIPTRGQ